MINQYIDYYKTFENPLLDSWDNKIKPYLQEKYPTSTTGLFTENSDIKYLIEIIDNSKQKYQVIPKKTEDTIKPSDNSQKIIPKEEESNLKQKLINNKKLKHNDEDDIKNLRAKNLHKISMFLNNFIEENKLKRANSMMSLRHSKTISSFTTCDDSICLDEIKDKKISINLYRLNELNEDNNNEMHYSSKKTKEIIQRSQNLYLNDLAQKKDNNSNSNGNKDKFGTLNNMQRPHTMTIVIKMTPQFKEEEEIDGINIKYNKMNQLSFITVDLILKKIINSDFLNNNIFLLYHFCQQCFCFVHKDILFKKLFNCYKYYKNKKTLLSNLKNLIDFINIIVIEMLEYHENINYTEMQIGLIKKFYNELICDLINNFKEENIENNININNNMIEIKDEKNIFDINNENTFRSNFPLDKNNLLNANLNFQLHDINIFFHKEKEETKKDITNINIKKQKSNEKGKKTENKDKLLNINIEYPKLFKISKTLKKPIKSNIFTKNANAKPLGKIEESIKEENNEDDSYSSSSSKNSGSTKKNEKEEEDECCENEEENEINLIEDEIKDNKASDIINNLLNKVFPKKNILSLKDEIFYQINNILKLLEVQNKDIISLLKIRQTKEIIPIYSEIKNKKKLINSDINKNNYDRYRTNSLYINSMKSSSGNIIINKNYFSITDWNTEDIGNKLTQVSKSLLNKIFPRELYLGVYLKKEKEIKSPNVIKCINNFNKLTSFIIEDIISYNTPKLRARVYEKWVQICDYCKINKNYNDCIAIYSALNNYIITGLNLTLKEVKYKIKNIFEKISIFCSCEDNYRNIRNEMNECEKKGETFIPYLGMLLRDINFVEESSKYINEKGCINFEKIEKINNLFEKYFCYKKEDKKRNDKQIPKELNFFDNLEIISEEDLELIANKIEPEFKYEKKFNKRLTKIDIKYFNYKKRTTIVGNTRNTIGYCSTFSNKFNP